MIENTTAITASIKVAANEAIAVAGPLRQHAQDAAMMPSVVEYIEATRTRALLLRQISQLERKLEVADLSARGRHARSLGASSVHQRASSADGSSALSSTASLAESIGAGGQVRLGGESTRAASLSGRRGIGGTASVLRGVYAQLGSTEPPPAPSQLRLTLGASAANATATALSGRGPGGSSAAGVLLRNVTGAGPVPRCVGGFFGAMSSSAGAAGNARVGKLILGRPGSHAQKH